ncbi:MAG: VIT domain-containing protein [Myxococcota bacterium]
MRLRSVVVVAAIIGCAGEHFEDEASPLPELASSSHAAVAPMMRVEPAMITWAPTERTEPLAKLTASDGTGPQLVDAKVKAVIQEPLAFTELHLTFKNTEARTREGRFEITLPDGAAISRFAMKIDGRWQEGEVVEKQRARRIYEDFLHRKQDPALLEQDAGNTFRARVFPIPASGEKELILSFSQEVVDGRWSMPLAGLDTLDLGVDVTVVDGQGGARTLSETREDWTPDADLQVDVGAPGAMGLSAGEYHVIRVQPEVSTEQAKIRDLTVLLDTSASRALSLDRDVHRLGDVIRGLNGGTQVTIGCFDQTVELCWSGAARDFMDEGALVLARRTALGASDLEAALRWASARGHAERLLLVSDGLPTAGAREAGDLERILAASPYRRADVLAPSGARDMDLLTSLVRGDLPHDGVVADIASADAGSRLLRTTESGIEVSVPGAAWVWPNVLNGVQPGDETLVYAVLPGGESPVLHLNGKVATQPAGFRPAQRPLLERAAVGANLARLQAKRSRLRDEAERATITQEIVALSTQYRVLTEDTALLVLETEADYAQYELTRSGLADIMEVGPTGVVLRDRNDFVVGGRPVAKGVDEKKKEAAAEGHVPIDSGAFESSGTADQGLGAVGGGGGGGGVAGRGMADAPAMARPDSSAESAEISDRLVGLVLEETVATGASEANAEPEEQDAVVEDEKATQIGPWDGRYLSFRALLDRGDAAGALKEAWAWRTEDPADVMALIALGEALAATGDPVGAARAYGSIIDLFPSRADLRRMAGERLESLGDPGMPLALDTFQVAVEQRPDQVTGSRLYAFALVQAGRPADAFDAMELALTTETRRRSGVEQLLREDLGLIGAAWIAKEPAQRAAIVARAQRLQAVPPTGPSTRFVLSWETDANDVDLHIRDSRGGHAFYSSKALPSGGALIADVTNGYGPEAFVIQGDLNAGPYALSAHYYSRGPMGYGMGTLQVVRHDGAGGIVVDSRPFVVMVDSSTVDLGTVAGL